MANAQDLIEQVAQGEDPRVVLGEDTYADKVRGLLLQMKMTLEEISYYRRQIALKKQSYQNLQRELAALRGAVGSPPHKV